MTRSVEVPLREFCLTWTLSGDAGGHVDFVLSGEVTLLDNERFYKVDGVLYIAHGGTYCREIGSPRLHVRRNGVEASGRQWGWENICAPKSCNRLCSMDGYFVRTGYWAPADRAIQLGIVAERGLTRRKSYSPTVTVRMRD